MSAIPSLAVAAALAAIPSVTVAKTACSADALNALRISGVRVTQAAPAAPSNSPSGTTPSYCAVEGTIETTGDNAPSGSVRFELQLPDAWKQRFLFMGVGGNGGKLRPSVNQTDRAEALDKGYATIVQDGGHVGNGADASWVQDRNGKRDIAKIVDFEFRAAHSVTVIGKQLVRAYYGAPVRRAYFDGCSTGGRMAMMEAERYPSDYDGIIAGDPAIDYHAMLLRFAVQKAALSSAKAWLSPDTLKMVDKAVTARCDAIDGTTDGLVQDPARCPVKAADLQCHGGKSGDCLNADQTAVLRAFTSAVHDRRGHVLYPGMAITNLSGPRGLSYWQTGVTAPNLANPESPWSNDPQHAPLAWSFARQALSYWMGQGADAKMLNLPIDLKHGRIGEKLVAEVDKTFGPMETKNPLRMLAFIQQDRKMIIYHGTSDPAIAAARTVQFYNELAATLRGVAKAQANVRLFLVPGMQHCSGGIGPDQFDTLSAIEAWVEQGKAPDAILASTRPDAPEVHNLPLCPYPRQARYSGHGEMKDAANWACVGG